MSNIKKSFHVDALEIQVYNSQPELAQDVAAYAQKYLQAKLEEQNSAAVLLATGNSQLQFLHALIALGGVDWSKITFFHLDEYLGIPANHAASFRYYLHERVEKYIKPQQFNYIQGDTNQPLTECDRYSKLLKAQPIDLCCLGIGENGHIAFNDPSVADFDDPYVLKLVKLDEVNRQQQVSTGYFPNLETVPQYAFSVTIPMICSAKKILCLAPSQRKSKVVKTMLQKIIHTDCPASILRRQAHAILFLDVDSASLIEMDN